MLGKHHTEKAKEKISKSEKGKYISEETKKKISEALKGNTNTKGKHLPPFSEETKRHMSEARKGKHHSLETKRKMSEALKGNKNGWKGGISSQKGYHNFMIEKRRVKKLGNGGSHTLGEWENLKAQYNWTCPMCGRKEPEIELTEDHIIPLSKGGSDNIENIQPLCRSCNSKKYTQIFRVNPDKSLGLF
jgi:5-methylcytosine-specific restriction endonuclease McrA